MGRHRLLLLRRQVREDLLAEGHPAGGLRLYYLNEDGTCSDTPLEVNTGKSYVP